ncbi:MAG: hypothetical protein H7231_12975 [Rhodoferax sp.]|nr:hypothetical protein [Actinomycetota bacterium]
MSAFLDVVMQARQWVPLNDVAADGTRLVRGLFRVGAVDSGVYAMTRQIDDDDLDVPPQVGAVLLALDDEVAVAIYDTAPLPANATTRPGSALPAGVAVLTFAEACARGGGRSAHSAAYRFADGSFSHSTVRADGSQWHYVRAEPGPDDRPVGVRLRLRRC